MARLNRRYVAALVGVAVFSAVAALSGCDWISGSENVQRTSPFLNNLVVSPTFVFCGERNPITVSFDYSDLQGDISEARLLLRHTDSAGKVTEREESYLWPENISRSTGRLTVPPPGDVLFFPCPSGASGTPSGDWQVEVTALDDKGHESNILKGKITLI
jgi:hypothetical protein